MKGEHREGHTSLHLKIMVNIHLYDSDVLVYMPSRWPPDLIYRCDCGAGHAWPWMPRVPCERGQIFHYNAGILLGDGRLVEHLLPSRLSSLILAVQVVEVHSSRISLPF